MAGIKDAFSESFKNYSSDQVRFNSMLKEVEKNYSDSGRHYHNLTHLDDLFQKLHSHRNKFVSWDAVVFAIVYHDIVYKTTRSNNEEKSADLAVQRLTDIGFPDHPKSVCREFILATKKHEPADYETNLFTDADLSILGAEPEAYKKYYGQIRREYSIYPDLLYNPGRKKVLQHFLGMHRIFKTDEFFESYEKRTRVNLQNELNELTGV